MDIEIKVKKGYAEAIIQQSGDCSPIIDVWFPFEDKLIIEDKLYLALQKVKEVLNG